MPIPEKYYKSARTDPRLRQCLHCRYDLSGSPEGTCPECGKAFTFAEIRAAFVARQQRPWLRHDIARGCVVVQLLLLIPILFLDNHSDLEEILLTTQIIFGLAALRLALRWRETIHTHTHERLWLLVPMWAAVGWGAAQVSAAYGVALAAPLMLLAPRLLCPRADRWEARFRLAAIASVLCGPLALALLGSLRSVGEWADWQDFRPGQYYRQYPLRQDELRWVAGLMTVYAAVAVPVFLCHLSVWIGRIEFRATRASLGEGGDQTESPRT